MEFVFNKHNIILRIEPNIVFLSFFSSEQTLEKKKNIFFAVVSNVKIPVKIFIYTVYIVKNESYKSI